MRRARARRTEPAAKPRRGALEARHAWHASQAGPDAIVCRLCGKALRTISYTHLRRIHGWENDHPIERYKRQFGLPVACCHATRRTLRREREDYWARRGRRWPRERVLDELRRRHRAGLSLAYSRLGLRLQLAIHRRFGTWARAMLRAGFDPDVHRLCRRWTQADIAMAIRRLHQKGEPLCGSHVERVHPGLHSAAFRVLGNWSNALRAAGFDPRAHRQPSKWNLEIARTWVKERRAAGRPITASDVPSGLLRRVCRETPGGWTAFVESLGIPYPGRKRRRDWTDAAVLEAIRARRRRGLPLNQEAVAKESQSLTHQARNRFGSWDAALRAAGIDPSRVRLSRPWSRDDVLTAIRARHAAGRPMNFAAAHADDPRLVKAAQGLFPWSWGRALAAAGLALSIARRPVAKARRRPR